MEKGEEAATEGLRTGLTIQGWHTLPLLPSFASDKVNEEEKSQEQDTSARS